MHHAGEPVIDAAILFHAGGMPATPPAPPPLAHGQKPVKRDPHDRVRKYIESMKAFIIERIGSDPPLANADTQVRISLAKS